MADYLKIAPDESDVAFELPIYGSGTSSDLAPTALSGDDSVLRGTGVIRVDVTKYWKRKGFSKNTMPAHTPDRLATFLINYVADYEEFLSLICEHIENETNNELKLVEVRGIRLPAEGPAIYAQAWSRLGKKLDRLEVVLDRSALGLRQDEKQRLMDWVYLCSSIMFVLLFLMLVITAMLAEHNNKPRRHR